MQSAVAPGSSKRFGSFFAGTDFYDIVERQNHDFAVAAQTGFRRVGYCANDRAHEIVRRNHLNAQLGDEFGDIFNRTIDIRMTFLVAMSARFADRQSRYAHRMQGVLDAVQPEWLDDGDNKFHGSDSGRGVPDIVEAVCGSMTRGVLRFMAGAHRAPAPVVGLRHFYEDSTNARACVKSLLLSDARHAHITFGLDKPSRSVINSAGRGLFTPGSPASVRASKTFR